MNKNKWFLIGLLFGFISLTVSYSTVQIIDGFTGNKSTHVNSSVLEKPNLHDIVLILGIETNTLYDNKINSIHFSNCTDLIKLLTIVNTNDIVFETVKMNTDTITCKLITNKDSQTFIVRRL